MQPDAATCSQCSHGLLLLASLCRPSSLDALVYGHLASVRHLPAGHWVKEAAPALLRFYAHVHHIYFADERKSAAESPNVFQDLDLAIDSKVRSRLEKDKLIQQYEQAVGGASADAAANTSASSPSQTIEDVSFGTHTHTAEAAVTEIRKTEGINADLVLSLGAVALSLIALRHFS